MYEGDDLKDSNNPEKPVSMGQNTRDTKYQE